MEKLYSYWVVFVLVLRVKLNVYVESVYVIVYFENNLLKVVWNIKMWFKIKKEFLNVIKNKVLSVFLIIWVE